MKKLLLLCFSFVFVLSAWAQEREVSGKVTSAEDASTLPGVNVVLKGTTNGTVTDTDGNYKLNVPAAGGTLVFSFIGLQTSEVVIGNRSTIDVGLGLDIQQLTEVVVTGTGVATEKRKLAIAVESVNADKLPATPTASIDQALIGKIAGAQISSVSGTPGAQVQILLRGVNTLQRGTAPMILVDGVQLFNTSLNTLDLSSVERVEVIQGAAAATIYGAQGANGVIQVFTKRGKAGQMNIDFSTSYAVNDYLNIGNVSKGKLHAFGTDAAGNVVDPNGVPLTLDPATLQYSGSIVYNALDPQSQANKPYVGNFKYYDHFNQFFQSAGTANNSIRISGGTDKIDFAFSVSNNHQGSNIKNGGYYDRSNFTSNIGAELFKGFKLRSITQLAVTNNTTNSYIYGMFNSRPFVDFDLKTPEGDYGSNFGSAAGVNGFNPNFYTQYTDNTAKTLDVIQNFIATYKFSKFVELDSRFGINHQRSETVFSVKNQGANANVAGGGYGYYWGGNFVDDYTGEIDRYASQSTFLNWLSKATVTFDFAKDFNINLPIKSTTQAAFDYRSNTINNHTSYAQNLPVDAPFTDASAQNFRVVQGVNASDGSYQTGKTPFVTYGYLVNQRFDYKDFAGISGGFRSDFSSAFGKGSLPFTFPRGDAYFRVSGLDFWDNSGISKVLLEFKVRAAYGQAGIQPFAFDRYVTLNPSVLGGTNGFKIPTGSKNPALNVEVSSEIEIGTDLVFNVLDNTPWANNIALSATYWDRTSDKVIYGVDLAPSAGVGTIKTNAFGLASNGLQISLSTQLYHSSNLTWDFTANFSKQTSSISSVQGNGQIVVTSSAGSTNYVLKAGEKIGQLNGFLGLHSVGQIDPTTGAPYIDPAQQPNYSVASNGWVVDSNTKQPYFTPKSYSFGDPNPNFNMSFINSFNYKGFLNVGFQFDWVSGSHLYNQTKEWLYRDGISSDYNNPIAINGETGAWTAFYRGVYAQVQRNGTKNYFYEDASFVRLRNVNVSLDLAKVFKLPAFKKLQLVLTGRNLWTGTSYTGFDPEISSGTLNSAFDRGTDHNTLPNLRSYQVGLNIGF